MQPELRTAVLTRRSNGNKFRVPRKHHKDHYIRPFPHAVSLGWVSGALGTCGVVPRDELEPPEEHSTAFGKASAQMLSEAKAALPFQAHFPWCVPPKAF